MCDTCGCVETGGEVGHLNKVIDGLDRRTGLREVTTDADLVWFSRSLGLNGNNKRGGLERATEDGLHFCLREGAVETAGGNLIGNVVINDFRMEDGCLVVAKNVGASERGHGTYGKTGAEVPDEVGVIVKKVVFSKKEFEGTGIIRMNNLIKEVRTQVDTGIKGGAVDHRVME